VAVEWLTHRLPQQTRACETSTFPHSSPGGKPNLYPAHCMRSQHSFSHRSLSNLGKLACCTRVCMAVLHPAPSRTILTKHLNEASMTNSLTCSEHYLINLCFVLGRCTCSSMQHVQRPAQLSMGLLSHRIPGQLLLRYAVSGKC